MPDYKYLINLIFLSVLAAYWLCVQKKESLCVSLKNTQHNNGTIMNDLDPTVRWWDGKIKYV